METRAASNTGEVCSIPLPLSPVFADEWQRGITLGWG